jgi:hypothetical protein
MASSIRVTVGSPEPPLEALALGGVPRETLERMAAARDRCPPTLRALLVSALACPDDRIGLMALRDWIDEFADVPESVWVPTRTGRPAVVGFDQPLGWVWWHKASGLHPDLVRAILPADRGAVSLRQVCEMTPCDFLECPGVGVKRLAQLRTWLGKANLRLKGDAPPAAG